MQRFVNFHLTQVNSIPLARLRAAYICFGIVCQRNCVSDFYFTQQKYNIIIFTCPLFESAHNLSSWFWYTRKFWTTPWRHLDVFYRYYCFDFMATPVLRGGQMKYSSRPITIFSMYAQSWQVSLPKIIHTYMRLPLTQCVLATPSCHRKSRDRQQLNRFPLFPSRYSWDVSKLKVRPNCSFEFFVLCSLIRSRKSRV